MTSPAYALDLITLGRSSVDLYGEQVGGRLEDVLSFRKYVGGCPTNIAVGTARLGLRSGIVTRVGEDHMGRFIVEELEREGVATQGIVRDPTRLTSLVLLGIRDSERFPLIFYRENCADAALTPDEIDPAFIASARALLVTGTHLSRPALFDASRKAVDVIRANGGRVILDIDYRPVLWGLTRPDLGENRFVADAGVTASLQRIVPDCDLIVGTEEEFHILGGSEDSVAALRAVRALGPAQLVLKRGERGCVVFPGDVPDDLDQGISADGFPIEVFNVLGAGDAFLSGFLAGWLDDAPLAQCCRMGNAAGAIVVSRHGCAPASPTRDELDWLMAGKARSRMLRKEADLEHLHWAETRRPRDGDIMVLAIDHRSQIEQIADAVGADRARIPAIKALALAAVERLAAREPGLGILADGRYGQEALAAAAGQGLWIGRPIELPGSRPLDFDTDIDVASELRQWPVDHVVKCLCFYHPDDPPELRERQERQLLRLASACRETGHEFLLEIIAGKDGPVGADTVARVIRRIYALGIRPDWWKLEPSADPAAWSAIERTVADHDPLCRGIVLLGLSAPEEELIASFRVAASVPSIRGFAVGRTIFAEPTRAWLAGEIDDEGAIRLLYDNFARLVAAWKAARGEASATAAAA
ncbi:MAG: 5-dehydro-2-deoxygluconokinase [Sphingomonas fennica]